MTGLALASASRVAAGASVIVGSARASTLSAAPATVLIAPIARISAARDHEIPHSRPRDVIACIGKDRAMFGFNIALNLVHPGTGVTGQSIQLRRGSSLSPAPESR